jgi:LPXTG-site transpeptidase (sortase) family protein
VPDGSTKSAILASLESGVGLYPGSVEPGTTGRTILLAHSSRASWYRGGYATVFALLPKLEQFDEFTIAGGGKKYTYQVFATKVMTPDEANRFTATTPDDAEVDLVTCYPIGSASKRIVVQAKLIAEEGI